MTPPPTCLYPLPTHYPTPNPTMTPFNPKHYRVLRLWLLGSYTHDQIGQLVGLTPGAVAAILSHPVAQEILAKVKAKYLDTLMEVQTIAQLAAPECIAEKVRLALESGDERVRTINTREILELAGHKPDLRLVLENQAAAAATTLPPPEELRASLLETVTQTIH